MNQMKIEGIESFDNSIDFRSTKENLKIVEDLDTAGLLARQRNRFLQLN